MIGALPLTRLETGPYEEWDVTEVAVVPGVQRTSLHFGRFAEASLYRPALVAITSTLSQARSDLTLWCVGRDDFGSNSRRLEEKLYESRLRKRLERLRPRLRLNRVQADHGIYAIQFEAALPDEVDFDGILFMQSGDGLDLLNMALEGGGKLIAKLAGQGGVVIDFTQDRDLLVCDLITAYGNSVDHLFELRGFVPRRQD